MKKQITIFLLLLFSVASFAQVNSSPNFKTFIDEFYNDNDSIMSAPQKSGYFKDIERLHFIWTPRLYPHYNAAVAAEAWYEYTENFNNSNSHSPVQQEYYADWECKGPFVDNNNDMNFTGQMHRITFDPNYDGVTNQTVYAASSFGGLWRSENGGNSWSVVNTDEQLPYCGVADVAINNQNPDIIYIGTGNADSPAIQGYGANEAYINPIQTQGIYRSTNRGETWEAINQGFLQDFQYGGTIRRVIVDPSDGDDILSATTNGVYRCTNATGSSPGWHVSTLQEDIRGLEYKPGNSSIVYASGTDIFKSVDEGETWVSMTGINTGLNFQGFGNNFIGERINIAVTPDNPNKLYAYITGTEILNNSETKVGYIYMGWKLLDTITL